MNNNEERVRLLERLIRDIKKDNQVLTLIEKELEYLKFQDTTREKSKGKLLELLGLATRIRSAEYLYDGMVKL